MKKTIIKIITILTLILILLSACSSSRKNKLVYRYQETDTAVSFDSLQTVLLSDSGAEMLVAYPDSDVVIIQYDRFNTHQEIIETHFEACGYRITLIKKSKIEKKDQPWGKK